ncbi:MAG: transketolase C-terminal domain-containing protein [Candidatus Micrarchaeota archaeon]
MTERLLMTGNAAAAWGARLAKAEVIPCYPITPQTEIIETLAKWKAEGSLGAEFVQMDSEHSVMSAAVGASATGARVFTATSSQGLLLMYEMLFIASGLRLPIVMANCSRALSAPISLWCDHNDFLTMKPSSWLMFHAQNNQEVIDSVLMAYKIAENENVLLPAVVNMDGYVLSFTSEPTELPDQADINKFLGKYSPEHAFFKPGKPMIQGSAIMKPHDYTFFKEQVMKAQDNALELIPKVCKEWEEITGRKYGLIDAYRLEDAEIALVTQGSISTTARQAVDDLRKKGTKAGLLRLRVIRPFPHEEIAKALKKAHGVAVIDKNIEPGMGGSMFPEIRSALYDLAHPPIVSNFIVGLGGNPESMHLFEEAVKETQRDVKKGEGTTRLMK